jgi:DNA-directed RNA polymerase subunit RPC12/RpoP
MSQSSRETVHVCERCGEPMEERQCKIVCRNCGYARDCSDP